MILVCFFFNNAQTTTNTTARHTIPPHDHLPAAQAGNPKPRMYRLPQAKALINRLGFNNNGLAAFIENVKKSSWRRHGGILGLNIGKNASTPMERAIDEDRKRVV